MSSPRRTGLTFVGVSNVLANNHRYRVHKEKKKGETISSLKMSNNNFMHLESEIVSIRIICIWEQNLTRRNVGTKSSSNAKC